MYVGATLHDVRGKSLYVLLLIRLIGPVKVFYPNLSLYFSGLFALYVIRSQRSFSHPSPLRDVPLPHEKSLDGTRPSIFRDTDDTSNFTRFSGGGNCRAVSIAQILFPRSLSPAHSLSRFTTHSIGLDEVERGIGFTDNRLLAQGLAYL